MDVISEQLRHKDVQEMNEQEIRAVFTFALTNEEIDPDFKRIAEMFLSVLKENADQRQQIQQYEATIAAMRGALELSHELFQLGESLGYNSSIPDEMTDEASRAYEILEIVNKALSNTAGAELLAESDRLQRENKALRCCGNCEYDDDQGCKLSQPLPFNLECKDFKDWVIAERLVNKGE